jgi:hypothetical protein
MKKTIPTSVAVAAAVAVMEGQPALVARTTGMTPLPIRPQLTQSSNPQNSVTVIAELPSPSGQWQLSHWVQQ